jgi:magnesium-transporting ATPase (P-type)
MKSFLKVFIDTFEDFSLKVLLIAGVVTLVFGYLDRENNKYGWLEGVSVLFACLFISFFTASMNFAKEKQYLKLFEEIRNLEVNAIRG